MNNQKNKWRFAIGTTSRVPHSGGSLHYLIADFDDDTFPLHDPYLCGILFDASNVILQRTKHGWHLYSDLVFEFDKLINVLKAIGADLAWVSIGKERGYYFLADKQEIDFPYSVEHMVIHYDKKTA